MLRHKITNMDILRGSNKRIIRHRRVRAKIIGTENRPRMSVFRSNRHLVVQLIDDISGKTLAYADDRETASGVTRPARANALGEHIAKKAGELAISHIVFDRGGYAYHGVVKAVAEGARKGGLIF